MSKGRRPARAHLLCGAAISAIISMSGVAFAQDAEPISIPSQSLATALNSFGVQTGRAVMFKPELAAGKQSRAVDSAGDPELALNELLSGTGLSWRRQGDLFMIVEAADPQSGSAAGDGAEGTVDTLIVTAQKREEDIQDVPIAISAFTQEDLTRSQVAGGPDLMTQVPNFTFTKTNFSGYSIQIRGIGTQAISATTDPAVAVAFNNTPFIRNRFFEQEFFDLARVEVLRGPQGTLYGRNATAGVVNIISAKPKLGMFEAKASADVANYSSSRLEGMLNLPIFEDKAALRIAGAWTKRDGFVKNLITGDQTDGRDLWSTRVSLRLQPVSWMSANFIWEHFEENDDRLRSAKQLCKKDPGPATVNGIPIAESGDPVFNGDAIRVYFTQACLPASLYSPDSFQTPNGFGIPYGPAASLIGAPVDTYLDTYESAYQSRDLREIETRIKPEYEASTDTVELQLQFELPGNLTLASETGFARDYLFSFEDFNRFSTRAGTIKDTWLSPGGILCNPQIGCSDRLQAGDLSTARSQHFSQEFRLSSDYDGPFNFSVGANFLRYDTEDKYYVFINTLGLTDPKYDWCDSIDPHAIEIDCKTIIELGYVWSPIGMARYAVTTPGYRDLNNIHHLNDLGRNYFLSKNPYGLRSYAAFGEAYYNLTPNLKATAGLRWTVDRKTAPQIPSWFLAGASYGTPTNKTIHQDWREPTGRLALDWKPDFSFTDETLIYGSYVHGYKAGGANPPPPIVVGAPVACPTCGFGGYDFDKLAAESLTHPEAFSPEFVNAYEIGTKNTLLDGRLTLNLNAFYYDYTGYQISEIVDRSAVNLNFDAEIWGSELEVDWRPLENLRLAFKGGYEKTRMADGSQAIDLMDRTAGMPGWVLHRPFPTFPSNCVVPEQYAMNGFVCAAARIGNISWEGANHGEGFYKDLSGNELPNAPHYTATITADYTLPFSGDWLATLHTDLYYQSEAWTRVFNTEGYDKLKAYNNINVAAIFANEDAGWTVMAYVKNVLDKDNITGAFLNSDDTGLTTNVFLNEPRLYGLRVTKAWTGSDWWSGHANTSGYYPYRLELNGQYDRSSGGREILVPGLASLSPEDHPYPVGVQNDLDRGSGGGVKFTYRPQARAWSLSAGVRYGRFRGSAEQHPSWGTEGGYRISEDQIEFLKSTFPDLLDLIHRYYWFDSTAMGFDSYSTATARNEESHAIVDFAIGRDVGIGWGDPSHLDFGLQYAKLRSSSNTDMHGRPDSYMPPYDISAVGVRWHMFWDTMDAVREFSGAGPSVSWTDSLHVLGESTGKGRIDADLGLGGSVLFGKQTANLIGRQRGLYVSNFYKIDNGDGGVRISDTYDTSFAHRRSTSTVVPSVNANLGLTYTLGGLKLTSGYRWERYFNAIDAGIAERKTYDRQMDGPYMKISIGFGG